MSFDTREECTICEDWQRLISGILLETDARFYIYVTDVVALSYSPVLFDIKCLCRVSLGFLVLRSNY